MLLQIEEREIQPGVTLVALTGKLSLGRESQRFEAHAAGLADKGAGKVILDLTGVDYMDSAGVGVVVLSSGKIKAAGGTMVVVAPEGRVRQVLTLAGVDGILNLTSTVEAAAAAGA
jgi:anti-sigma B factor antagonist